ncbi:MAG: ACT domain-containing protein [Thomasclavelia sp.]|jgi:ACT domain-containing protein|nr:ACT domain-containing protein [Tissierellia bacterium]MDD8048787.1 ACT domain-containing protein [Thomasclavelia sp.]
MEKGIITVVGKDRVGIISNICSFLASKNINILDISQTIIDDYFNMMMIVDITNMNETMGAVCKELDVIGDEMGVSIKLQHENIFAKMHRI